MYMGKLLASAELRKRDFLIAQEKKYKKEREVEGEEFAGKEKFVTNAYKRQQEELRKAEEEEKLREGALYCLCTKLENARKKSQGMASFYRNLLEEEEMKHDTAVAAAEKAAKEGTHDTSIENLATETPREKKLAEEAREINTQLGTNAVLINDEGEVVDKRQLLKGGLNVRPKHTKLEPTSESAYQAEYEARRIAQRDRHKERETRLRQQKVIEDQYEQRKRKVEDDEAEREEEMRLRAKSKKTSNEVMSAKERYLARKRAAAQGL
jgi:coiled-coil domain-containing protein 55